MEKLLNGISISTLFESVGNVLDVHASEVLSFIKAQRYRVKMEGIFDRYDKLEVDVILDHFNLTPKDIQIDAITVSHVAAVIDENSFYRYGMLSLRDLFIMDTPFRSFMLEYGVTPVVQEDGTLQIHINGENQPLSGRLRVRINSDRCINGFMFGDNPEADRNVSEMVKCPEFISDISRDVLLNPSLIEDWIKRATPSVISFKVLRNEIDKSTFPYPLDYEVENQCFLLLQACERLLFAATRRESDNPMIYLKEHINIGADRIIEIREITP